MLSENLALLARPRSRSTLLHARGEPNFSSEAEWSGRRLLTGHLGGSIPSAGALANLRSGRAFAPLAPRTRKPACARAHASRWSTSTRIVSGVNPVRLRAWALFQTLRRPAREHTAPRLRFSSPMQLESRAPGLYPGGFGAIPNVGSTQKFRPFVEALHANKNCWFESSQPDNDGL